MKLRPRYELPKNRKKDFDRMVRLEWWSVAFRVSIVLILGLVLGSSQAMKAAWVEDALGLTPSIAFLVACHFRRRAPTIDYPYGYERSAVIAFLCAAVALSLFGFYLLIDSVLKLIAREHTTIGAIQLWGHTIWLGWLMIAALVYSVIPPFILGHFQVKAAQKVHEKTVLVDARMSKADWATGLAAIVGIIGVGFGLWWFDAAAGGLIALSVCKDGVVNLKEAAGDLMDRRPHKVGSSKKDPLPEELEDMLSDLPWVKTARVRLREEGAVFAGEAFVVPEQGSAADARQGGASALVHQVEEAAERIRQYDWRIYEVVVVPVSAINEAENPRGG